MPTYANSTDVSARLFRKQRYVVIGIFSCFAFLLLLTAYSGHSGVAIEKATEYYENVKGSSSEEAAAPEDVPTLDEISGS